MYRTLGIFRARHWCKLQLQLAGLATFSIAWICLSVVAAEELSVGSWNIVHLSAVGNKERKPEDYTRLSQIADRINADVIALQEVDTEYAKKVFDSAEFALEISSRNHSQNTGFAIRTGLSYERQPDLTGLDYSGKGDGRYGTHVALDLGGTKIDLLSVHLKSYCFSNNEDKREKDDCFKLNRQVPVLESWIDERLQLGRHVIVLGDFNRRFAIEGDRVWADLADGEPADIALAAGSGTPACWGGRFREFIDHIVLSESLQKQLVGFEEIVFKEAQTKKGFDDWKERLSDHCPIRATFEFGTSEAREQRE